MSTYSTVYGLCCTSLYIDVGGPVRRVHVVYPGCGSVSVANSVRNVPRATVYGTVYAIVPVRIDQVRAQAFGVRSGSSWSVYGGVAVGGLSVPAPVELSSPMAPGLVYGRFSSNCTD